TQHAGNERAIRPLGTWDLRKRVCERRWHLEAQGFALLPADANRLRERLGEGCDTVEVVLRELSESSLCRISLRKSGHRPFSSLSRGTHDAGEISKGRGCHAGAGIECEFR